MAAREDDTIELGEPNSLDDAINDLEYAKEGVMVKDEEEQIDELELREGESEELVDPEKLPLAVSTKETLNRPVDVELREGDRVTLGQLEALGERVSVGD